MCQEGHHTYFVACLVVPSLLELEGPDCKLVHYRSKLVAGVHNSFRKVEVHYFIRSASTLQSSDFGNEQILQQIRNHLTKYSSWHVVAIQYNDRLQRRTLL